MNEAELTREHALDLLRQMVLLRRFEEKAAEMYSAQKISGFLHLYVGEEAIAVGAMAALRPDDPVVATYREHGHAIVRGIAPKCVMAEMFGKANGCARGRGGSMHLFSVSHEFYGGYAIVGGGLPIAVGLALADKMQGRNRVTACFFGDGSTAEGEFHEALNLAAVWKLPVLFLCENNLYAMGTFLPRYESDTDIFHKAAGYGIPAEQIDGMDVLEVERVTRELAEEVRSGDGPRFLEMRTYRFRAHSMYDAEKYRTKDEVARWKERDPIPALLANARERGIDLEGELPRVEAEVAATVEESVRFAEEGPLEPVEELTRFVYVKETP